MAGGMSTGKKVAAILGGLALLGALCAGAGVLMLKNAAEGMVEDLQGRAPEVQAEGRAFAAGKTADACVDEGLRRGPGTCKDLEIQCTVEAAVFLHACLGAAPTDPATCDGVPPRSEVMAAAEWVVAACGARGYADRQSCSQVLQNGLMRYCDETRQ
jgi:hypothetical protein